MKTSLPPERKLELLQIWMAAWVDKRVEKLLFEAHPHSYHLHLQQQAGMFVSFIALKEYFDQPFPTFEQYLQRFTPLETLSKVSRIRPCIN